MQKNIDINEWLNKIKELIRTERTKGTATMVLDCAINIGEIVSPINTAIIKIGKEIASECDAYRLNSMLNGYIQGNNTEKRLNQLYSFVKSPERAFLVSNLFRKTLLENSVIICCLYGLILGECIDKDKKADYEDLIVLNALQNATDYELRYFMEIVEKYIDDKGYVDTKAINESELVVEYNFTLKWCKNNRILGIAGARNYDGVDVFQEYLVYISCTQKLYELLITTKQLMQYEWD